MLQVDGQMHELSGKQFTSMICGLFDLGFFHCAQQPQQQQQQEQLRLKQGNRRCLQRSFLRELKSRVLHVPQSEGVTATGATCEGIRGLSAYHESVRTQQQQVQQHQRQHRQQQQQRQLNAFQLACCVRVSAALALKSAIAALQGAQGMPNEERREEAIFAVEASI